MKIESVNFASYSEPSYEAKVDKKGYVNYGEDNLFPQYLISLFYTSPVHGALVSSIANMIYGNGIQAAGGAKLPIAKWNIEEDVKRACFDLKLQGGFCFEVMFKDGIPIQLYHIPFERVRSGVMDEYGDVHEYYHSLDWGTKRPEYQVVPSFNPEKVPATGLWKQYLYVKPFTAGEAYYPKPDYMGSLNWIEVDKRIATFHNSNLMNGMTPSFAVSFRNGVPEPEDKQQVLNDLKKSLKGEHNAGKVVVTFSDGGDNAPEFTILGGDDNDTKMLELSREATDKIMIGHRVTSPALFGVKTAGQLGTTEELKAATLIFDKNVIIPYRNVVVSALNKVIDQLGINDNITITSEVLFESHDHIPDSDAEAWLDYLDTVGEKIDADEWEIVGEQDVTDAEGEKLLHLEKVEFFKRFADPEKKSEVDTGLFKIRYRYSKNISNKSRTFCRNMVANANLGVVYRYEDIVNMGDSGVNSEFAAKGESTYSIWLYKGGVNCHHKWVRQVYKRKRERGRFLPNDGLNNDEVITESSAANQGVPFKDPNWTQANTAPIDTPSKGRKNG